MQSYYTNYLDSLIEEFYKTHNLNWTDIAKQLYDRTPINIQKL